MRYLTAMKHMMVAVLCLTACGKSKSSASAAPVPLADLDLSSRGPEWKGWSIKGPANAKIMEDFDNLRVAGKGCPITETCTHFDLILSQKPSDLKELKAQEQTGAKSNGSTIEFTAETADSLDWTTTFTRTKSLSFDHIIKVGGIDVSCSPLNGVSDQADADAMKAACTTIVKH